MSAKPIYRLSVSSIPDGDEINFIEEATVKLEAAGYVVVLTSGPNEIHAPPVDNTRALMAAAILGGMLGDVSCRQSPRSAEFAVQHADELLKELAK